MRPHLVFVRAGSKSLHREAIAADPQRNWDCCVSWYIQPPEESIAEHYSATGSNKFDAFADLYASTLRGRGYRRFLLLDDDVRFRPGDISRLFDICEREDLQLCQPALAWGTHASHLVTLRNPACVVRQVCFIEVMAPCFSARMLDELLPTFTLTRSTWGIDWAWASLLDGRHCIAVVDAVAVQHTKPVDTVDGAFYNYMRTLGVDPVAELQMVRQRFPSRGAPNTIEGPHVYRWAPARALSRKLMWLLEKLKPSFHQLSQALAGRRSQAHQLHA